MPEMRQHELARRAVRELDRRPGLGVDQLGKDESARAEVHAVLLFALAEERRADVADPHCLGDLCAPTFFEPRAERRLASAGLTRNEDTLDA
jgi:hypothetical protein